MIPNIYWNYPLFDYLYRKTTKLSHNHLFDHSIQLQRMPMESNCAICLTNLSARRLYNPPCDNGHMFHATCLLQHFQQGHADCPLCRDQPVEWVRHMEQLCTLYFIRADDTMWQRHPEYADRCPILFRTIQEATHVCAKLDGNLTYIWEYRRRFRKSTLQRAYHIIYVKPPKKLETYLQDSSTVYTANGKTYHTLEEAEEGNKVEDIYKHIHGDMGQPVYYPVYKRV